MRLPRRAKVVITVTVTSSAASVALVILRFAKFGVGPVWVLSVLAALVLASWLWPMILYRETTSETHHFDDGLFLVLALVLPPEGVVIAFFVATALAGLFRRLQPIKALFNLAGILLAACAGLAVIHAIAPPGRHLTLGELGAGVLGTIVYIYVNYTALAAVMAATGAGTVRHNLLDGLKIRSLLQAASVSLGLVGALAVSAYSMAAVLIALPFWAFRETVAGHFRARQDRSRLLGLFHATLDVHRTMGDAEVREALNRSASQLLRSPEASVVSEEPPEDVIAARMTGRTADHWLVVSGRSRAEPFDGADRALLDALAAVGSGALDNSALYEERRREQERLVAITSSLGEGVCAFDAVGHVTFLNPAAEELLGWLEGEVRSDEDRTPLTELSFLAMPALRAMRSDSTIQSERATFSRRNGEQFPVEYTCSPIRSDEGVEGAVIAFRDISERIAFEEQLAYHAFHDALTGLPNRRVFLDRLQHALSRASRSGEVHAVLFADVDRFKVANDSLGHQAGDQLLVAIAERLRGLAREDDTLARFGGDEFTLLVEDIGDIEAAAAVADRMIDLVRVPVTLDGGRTVMTSISVGIALATAGASPNDVLHDADVAMYQAKHRGAGRYEIFDATAMSSRSAEWVDLEVGLRQALDRHELTVYYQPLFATATRRIVGAEALVRWEHADRGMLQPSQFIGLAEETGLILPLGRFMLEEACGQAKSWQDTLDVPFSISVNLSARQFQSDDLVEEIRSALLDSGLDPGYLCLEITESLALQDIGRSITTLTDLKSLGVQLAIDDFGTGYSSLNYLKRFPVDVVKLDRTFVQDLDVSPVDAAIVAAVVDLTRTIGMTAVAEGVETEDQLLRLEAMGCPVIQGYHLGRPMPANELTVLLERAVEADAQAGPISLAAGS